MGFVVGGRGRSQDANGFDHSRLARESCLQAFIKRIPVFAHLCSKFESVHGAVVFFQSMMMCFPAAVLYLMSMRPFFSSGVSFASRPRNSFVTASSIRSFEAARSHDGSRSHRWSKMCR